MICADFLAGASLDGGNPEILLQSISRYYGFLSKFHISEVFLGRRWPQGRLDEDGPVPKARGTEARFERAVSARASAGAGARRLALPVLREDAAPAGAPPRTSEPSREAMSRQNLITTLCSLPRTDTSKLQASRPTDFTAGGFVEQSNMLSGTALGAP